MPLHYTREGYTFRADAAGLTIEPGPNPVTLNRQELAQLGLEIRDDYMIALSEGQQGEDVTGRVLAALHEAINRCRGPEEAWMAQDLKRAMILIGGLDDEVVQRGAVRGIFQWRREFLTIGGENHVFQRRGDPSESRILRRKTQR